MEHTEHERIGQRARRYRRVQGKTVEEIAGLAGISKGYLSLLERGERRWDSRTLTDNVAAALGIRSTDLIGSPYAPDSPQEAQAQQSVTPIYKALISSSLEDGAEVKPRSYAALVELDEQLNASYLKADYASQVRVLPHLIAELTQSSAQMSGKGRKEVLWRLLNVCRTASSVFRTYAYLPQAIIAADRCREIAEELEDPVAVSWSVYPRLHALLPDGAYRVAHRSGIKAANALEGRTSGYALEIYGALTLTSSFAAAASGSSAESEELIRESSAVANRVGEAGVRAGNFGPNNVRLHEMAIAVERKNYGKAISIASQVDPKRIVAKSRRAIFYADLGRAKAYEDHDAEALTLFTQAEKIAPLHVRRNVYVRDAVADMVDSARRLAGGQQLRGLAQRLGVL